MDATRKLTAAETAAIIERAQAVKASENLSNEAIGRVIGYSSSVVSQVLGRGTYGGDVEEVLRQVRSWLDGRDMRSGRPETPFVKTRIAAMISAVCTRARNMPTIGMVVTPSGYGKTAAFGDFAARAGAGCVYVQAGEMMSTARGLLIELAMKLNVSMSRAWPSTEQVYREVRGRLAGMYAGGSAASTLIIVDEATTLRPRAINMLRNLHDDPACRPGVVLGDTWRMDAEMKNPRRRRITGGYEQLTSRAGAVYRVAHGGEISQADSTAVARSVLKGLGFSGRLEPRAAGLLHAIANTPGALRNVVHRLQAVHDVAAATDSVPAYTKLELDYVATLVGAECELDHAGLPFGRAAARAAG